MGKSNKKTNVQVAPAVSAVLGKLGKKGKTDAGKVVDKVVKTKKQKRETKMAVQEDIKKLRKAPQEGPSKRKRETNGSDQETSSNSEEEVKHHPKKQSKPPTEEPSNSEDSSSDDELAKTASVPAESFVGAVIKRGEESSSSESDFDEDKEDAPGAAEKHTAPNANLEKKEESGPSESDADEDDAFEDSSCSEESSEKSSDEESEDENPMKIPKKPKTPTVQNRASGLQTLFVGNLSYDVGQHDLSEFFKGAGEVVSVRVATRRNGSSKGFGHVDFATEEDVKKALELNGQELFGRALRLEVARERDSNTPQTGNKKGGKDRSYTIFVKGFDKSLGQEQIRNSLREHFGSCGDITRISILKDHESGGPKGIAFVDFKNQNAYNKAIELNGSELGGCTLTIDEAKPKGDNSNGRGKGGGKFKGRGGGRGGRGDRGRGRGSGGRGRGRRGAGKNFSDD